MSVQETDDVPLAWRRVLQAIAVGQAAIGGAGLALAFLGAYNVAAAVSTSDWLHAVQHASALDSFAAVGAVAGAVVKIAFK